MTTWLKSLTRSRRLPGPGLADAPATGQQDTFLAGLELATDGIALLDSKGRLTTLNSRARALLQMPQAGLPGTQFWDAVPAPIAEKHRSQAEQVLGAGKAHTFLRTMCVRTNG
ncbi:PAS domain-containing protein [Polaromonas sp. UC242_47]|uniref:PAS domain-containing protein n=1 Tax=Polaromonas sp. UC242_47 TaxID=3374626 RepID=UPI00378CE820